MTSFIIRVYRFRTQKMLDTKQNKKKKKNNLVYVSQLGLTLTHRELGIVRY